MELGIWGRLGSVIENLGGGSVQIQIYILVVLLIYHQYIFEFIIIY